MWKLVQDSKWSVARWWFIVSGLCFLLLLTQTLNGTLSNILGLAWLWFFLCLGIGLVVVLFLLLKKEKPNLLIARRHHRLAMAFTIGYLLLVLFTVLGEGLFTQNALSLLDYRRQSLLWLLPTEALLLLIYYLAYFDRNNEIIRKPSLEVVATKAAGQYTAPHQAFKQEALELMAKAKTEEVFLVLQKAYENAKAELPEKLILLQAQWNKTTENERLGLITYDTAQTYRNRNNLALLEWIRKS
ncbi:MAG: hypothetical protein AAF242_00265 [Bacteroidota bacterium]